MDSEKLREIEERANKATPGPWIFIEWSNHLRAWSDDRPADCPPEHSALFTDDVLSASAYPGQQGRVFVSADNAAFIAHAREDIPSLIAEVRRLQAATREPDTIPRHLRIALSGMQRAFENDEPYTLATYNEDLQPVIDAVIAWGRRGAKLRP